MLDYLSAKKQLYYAGVAELADALDLGSSVPDVQVQLLSPAPQKKRQFSTEDCRFFLFFSLFSFRSSLFSKIVVSREKIREKREENR